MDGRSVGQFLFFVSSLALWGCSSSDKIRVAAPLPPLSDSSVSFNTIQPTAGSDVTLNVNAEENALKSCAFSSFHRKNMVGYEFDPTSQLSFSASPSFDAFNPSDFEVKVGLKFTKSLGGEARKRPKCTYSGYYGWLPYAVNNDSTIGGAMSVKAIKSYAKDRIDDHEERRLEKEKEALRGL